MPAGRPALGGGRCLPEGDVLAVARDDVVTVRDDSIAACPAGHSFTLPVADAQDVVSGPAEQNIAAASADQRVVARAAVEEVVSGETENRVRAAEPAQR